MQYEGSGDVFFVFYNGNEELTEMPKKDNPEGLGFEYGECDKGAHISWNRKKWAPMVSNLTKSKTKCKVYFAQNVANDYFERLAEKDTTNLAYDDTGDDNLRYIKSDNNPNNYIDIGDRDLDGNKILWRIIGVMNNMTVINNDGSENPGESLIKIIRANNIGYYSWDSSASGVNGGYGVNEWRGADIMATLNSGAYWNKEIGQCYSSSGDSQKSCDFSSTGLTSSVKDKLAKVRWNTGTIPYDFNGNPYKYPETFSVRVLYEGERSEYNGKKFCVSDYYECNDEVERTTTWDGYVGLMYPSDYGYAVGGSVRRQCLTKSMYDWDGVNPACSVNTWLYERNDSQWTLTPASGQYHADIVLAADYTGDVEYNPAYYTKAIRPVVYLKSNIKIKTNSASDYGSESNPFEIES